MGTQWVGPKGKRELWKTEEERLNESSEESKFLKDKSTEDKGHMTECKELTTKTETSEVLKPAELERWHSKSHSYHPDAPTTPSPDLPCFSVPSPRMGCMPQKT